MELDSTIEEVEDKKPEEFVIETVEDATSDLKLSLGGATVDLNSTGLDTSECSRDKNGGPCSSKKVVAKIAEVIKDINPKEKVGTPVPILTITYW